MQIIQRLRLRHRFQSPVTALCRMQAAAQYVMRHIGITGRAECLATRACDGRAGVVLVIQTQQYVPTAMREEIQQYFRRKLTELGELRGQPFWLSIRDGDDLSLAHRARQDSSSSRIASLIATANQQRAAHAPAAQLADLRMTVRQRLSERRRARSDSGYAPLAPMTNLGTLSAD